MALATVGSLATTNPSGGTTTTQEIVSATAGNAVAFYSLVLDAARTITGVTGGGAPGAWSQLATRNSGTGESIEIWWAKIETPGTTDATITWSATTAGMFLIHGYRQFTNGTGATTVWAADGGAGQNNASATTCAYPPMTPSGLDRLYVGYGAGLGGQALVSAGGTPAGSVFEIDPFDNCFTYNLNVDALVSPVSGAGASQQSYSVGGLLVASVPTTPLPRAWPYTARRRAANW